MFVEGSPAKTGYPHSQLSIHSPPQRHRHCKTHPQDNNYYNVSQLAAVTGEFKDVDARISEDVKTVSSQMVQ